MQQKSITFIGGGNMAQAIILGLLKQGYPATLITVSAPHKEKLTIFSEKGINITDDNQLAAQHSEVIVLAVKPQIMADVCKQLTQGKSAVNFQHKLIISIAAGISQARLSALLASAQHIVRVIPNTPALVGEGMSGLFATADLPTEFKQFTDDLFLAVGKTHWLNEETQLHALTAASGSSPAYFFRIMQAMQDALINQGLEANTARLLIQQSALGAAKMVIDNPDIELGTLKDNVTSKGGTTAAALAVFEQQHLADTINQAIQACITRSQEMEKLF